MNQLLDTNIIIYFLQDRLAQSLTDNNYYCSVISEIELLSHPKLDQTEEKKVKNFLSEIEIIGLEEEIKKTAIQLRKNHRLKLPDAIIAATALVVNAEILTNDKKFSKVPNLKYRHLKLKA